MKKILTISVAAYNVESTLDQLMLSLIDSGCMDRLDVLIVDDGSTDGTAEKGRGYAARYPESVRLISKANGGHGSTINTGIREAAGRYFRALDGDDWMDSRALQALLETLEAAEADLVITDFVHCLPGEVRDLQRPGKDLEPSVPLTAEEAFRGADWLGYHAVIWRTELLRQHGVRLEEHCFYVDNEYCLFPVPWADTALYCPLPVYCYRLGEAGQSVSPESRRRHIRDDTRVVNRLLEFCGELSSLPGLSEGKRKYILHGTARHCLWYIYSQLLFPPSGAKRREIRDFDRSVQARQEEVYREMAAQSRMVRMLRRTGYLAYGPIKLFKKIKGTG